MHTSCFGGKAKRNESNRADFSFAFSARRIHHPSHQELLAMSCSVEEPTMTTAEKRGMSRSPWSLVHSASDVNISMLTMFNGSCCISQGQGCPCRILLQVQDWKVGNYYSLCRVLQVWIVPASSWGVLNQNSIHSIAQWRLITIYFCAK